MTTYKKKFIIPWIDDLHALGKSAQNWDLAKSVMYWLMWEKE
jgi:hypothetical protein